MKSNLKSALKYKNVHPKQAYHRPWLYLIVILLLFPALLINLGLLSFIDDEGIRSLVALEMKLSGNLVTPTLHGLFYYNKPPLYNWILLLFFELTGIINEFTARFPTVLALMGYAGTIFYFFRRHYSTKIAFINAFLLITCGRILFWDSMLALIDMSFSWVIFTLFMVIFHEMEKRQFLRLFLLSYLLTAVGFLLKGLPAIVFQGITLLVYFIYKREFKRLFSWQHLLGSFIFIALVGGYYLVYHQYNDLENVFATLFTESSKRTPVHYGIGDTLLHIAAFPFEMLYHFLPWTLMVVFFFQKKPWHKIRKDAFICFNLLAFLANIIIYWISPEVYPRYLLMLFPLLFSAFIYLWDQNENPGFWGQRLFMGLLGFCCIVFTLGSLAPFAVERIQWVPYWVLKSIALFLSLGGLSFLFFRWRSERLLLFILVMLVFRIGFNWFVLPDRNQHDFGDQCRISSKEAGVSMAKTQLYVYWEEGMEPDNSFFLQPTNSFYLTNSAQKIIPLKSTGHQVGDTIILDPAKFQNLPYQKLDEIKARHDGKTYYVGIISEKEN